MRIGSLFSGYGGLDIAVAAEKGFLTVGTIAVITGLIVWAADVWTKWRNR